MSPPRGYDPKRPPGTPPKGPRAPPKWSGPSSRLTFKIQTELVTQLRRGATKRMAASLAGTNEVCLQNWLRRGRDAIEAGKRSRYTELVQDVERAEAEYQMSLVEAATEAIHDKTKNDKVIRWRLGVSAPKDFTLPRTAATPAATGGAFEMVSPDEAQTSLLDKLTRFLADAVTAPAPAEAPAPEAGDEE